MELRRLLPAGNQELHESARSVAPTRQGHSGGGPPGLTVARCDRRGGRRAHLPQQAHRRFEPPRSHCSPNRYDPLHMIAFAFYRKLDNWVLSFQRSS